MTGPAKIEFLTRKDGEPQFSVQAIESSQAYLRFKPVRLPESEWELTPQPRGPGGTPTYILKSSRSDRYLLLTPAELFLWERLDGGHSMSDLAREFFFEFGSFDFAVIRQFFSKLHQAKLLGVPSVSTLRRHLASRRGRWWARLLERVLGFLERISFRTVHADRFCSALYRRGGFLLVNPVAFGVSMVLTALAILAVIRLAPEAKQIATLVGRHPWLTTGLMVATVVMVSTVHVLIHALACKAYGRNVREVGFFLLQGVLPTFYADVTDIFMASRKARVMVAMAGPMVDIVVGALAFIGAVWVGPGLGRALLFSVGVLEWETALLNLYPFNFLELDGYHILTDLVAMPTLRPQAWKLLPALPRRLSRGKRLTKSEWIQCGYLALCLISVLVYVVTHLGAVGLNVTSGRK
jgi:putative peptide zinc metalloprotease protein